MTRHRFSLVALLVGLLTLVSVALAASCQQTGGSAVFNTFSGGTITIGGTDPNGQCNVTFYNTSTVNTGTSSLIMPGTSAGGTKICHDAVSGTALTASGYNPGRLTLPTFPTNSSNTSVSVNNTTSTVASGSYNTISLQNAGNATLTAPMQIQTLQLNCNNHAAVTLTAGTYYIQNFSQQAGCDIKLASSVSASNPVNLYIKNGMSLNGGLTCVNWVGSSGSCTSDLGTSGYNISNQHPEYLHIYVYTGNFTPQNNMQIAAGVYVDQGNLNLSNGQVLFVGEMLGENVTMQNNSNTIYAYKATGTFDSVLPSSSGGARTGYYALASPAVPATTTVGSYGYIASQRDLTSSGAAGTSGHLRAFPMQADGTLGSTPAWDAATLMTTTNRQNLLYSDDGAGHFVLLTTLASTSPTVFNPPSGVSASTIAGYIINPNASSGAYLAGRDATSLVGRPWTTQPILAAGLVIFAADDGILYAVNQSTGALVWAWMPREVVPQAQAPATLMAAHPWGQLGTTLLNNTVYLTGTVLAGQEHFSIALNADGTLNSIVWKDYGSSSSSPASPPGGAAPTALVTDLSKQAYVVNNKLVLRDTADATVVSTTSLPATAASNLVAISATAVYYGDSTGTVRGALGASDPGATGYSESVTGLNGAYLTTNGVQQLYLVANSADEVEGFAQAATGTWSRPWSTSATTSTGGAPTWISGGVVTALPTLTDGLVFIPLTVGSTPCTQVAYAFGPLSLATGAAALTGVTYKSVAMTSSNLSHIVSDGQSLHMVVTTLTANGATTRVVGGYGGNGSDGGGGSASEATGWAPHALATYTAAPKVRDMWRELGSFIAP